ncbi:MAG: protealysin inhibitor emfourin [Nitrospiraceae bacterium]
MHIEFECSGGFANLRLAYRANTEELPQELRGELLRLVEVSGIFALQESDVAPQSPGPPDVFFYRLSLAEGGRKKSLSFNDVTAPAELHPLLALLRELALEQRRKSK